VAGEFIEDMSIGLLKMDNPTLEKKYNFLSKDVTEDKLASFFEDKEIAKSLFNTPDVAMALHQELVGIKNDRDTLRNSIFKLNNDDGIHTPINLHRIIKNAKRMFEISNRSKTDLSPKDVITKLAKTLDSLVAVPGITEKSDSLLIQANNDSTLLTKIYLRSILNSKNVICNERLNSQSLDWILGEIKTKFEQSMIHPGEMVGSIAA